MRWSADRIVELPVRLAEQGRELLAYVLRAFEDCLQRGRLEHGFLRVRCESCHGEHLDAFHRLC